MSSETTYITRNSTEIEVSAKLEYPGAATWDYWEDTGYQFNLISDPTFCEFYAENDDGEEIVLTKQEIVDATTKLVDAYWEEREAYGA